jgi:hypothetical protein
MEGLLELLRATKCGPAWFQVDGQQLTDHNYPRKQERRRNTPGSFGGVWKT